MNEEDSLTGERKLIIPANMLTNLLLAQWIDNYYCDH